MAEEIGVMEYWSAGLKENLGFQNNTPILHFSNYLFSLVEINSCIVRI